MAPKTPGPHVWHAKAVDGTAADCNCCKAASWTCTTLVYASTCFHGISTRPDTKSCSEATFLIEAMDASMSSYMAFVKTMELAIGAADDVAPVANVTGM